jgi:hypothetical protein
MTWSHPFFHRASRRAVVPAVPAPDLLGDREAEWFGSLLDFIVVDSGLEALQHRRVLLAPTAFEL